MKMYFEKISIVIKYTNILQKINMSRDTKSRSMR